MKKQEVIIFAFSWLLGMIIGLTFAITIIQSQDIKKLKNEVLNLNNHVAFLEAHQSALYDNDGILIQDIQDLNMNDQIIADEINRIICKLIPSECDFIYN